MSTLAQQLQAITAKMKQAATVDETITLAKEAMVLYAASKPPKVKPDPVPLPVGVVLYEDEVQ